MAYQVVWSNTAESDFDEIIEYISSKQSPEKGIDFIQLVYRNLNAIHWNRVSENKIYSPHSPLQTLFFTLPN